MLEFHPTIVRAGELIELPRPILTCRLQDRWDFERLKVPRQDGDQVTGSSRDGVEITIEGEFGRQGEDLTLSEEGMFQTLSELRTALHVTGAERYWLALFRASDESDSRHFRDCTTTRFDVDLSNQRIYSYSVAIHAADPELYSGLLL